METRSIEHGPTRSRGQTPSSWPWIALIPFVTTGVLIAGMLTEPSTLGDGRSATGLASYCRAHSYLSNPTVLQSFSPHRQIAFVGMPSRPSFVDQHVAVCNSASGWLKVEPTVGELRRASS